MLLFGHEQPFVADRMSVGLRQVFGHDPIIIPIPTTNFGPGGTAFVVGAVEDVRKRIAADPHLSRLVERWRAEFPPELPGTTEPATDDWPYIYLRSRHIPVLYGVLGLMLLGLFARGWREVPPADRSIRWNLPSWHFFALGAAFLLLEVQNVSKAAVLLGSNWQVNAVVVAGVLGLALAGAAVAGAFPRVPLGPVYLLLVGSVVALYFLDIGRFIGEPYPVRVAIVAGVMCSPVLFSGVAFTRAFALADRRDAAFGANLIGVLAGGVLQSVTFIVGMQALLLLVAVLYLTAWATRPRN